MEQRGDAVEVHRVAERIPEQRGIEVGVDVDEPGRDVRPRRIDLALAVRTQGRADLCDASVGDAHISLERTRARAIDDFSTTDQELHDVDCTLYNKCEERLPLQARI